MNRDRFLLALTLVGGLSFCAAISSSITKVEAQASTPASHPEMPDGPGKDLIFQRCIKCHTVERITSQHKDSDGWTATITQMVGFGAAGTDDELGTILDYLTKNYGPAGAAAAHVKIEVNKETAAQLVTDLGVSDKSAADIVSYREKNGNFKSIDDLKKVPNIDTKKIDDKKDDLSFS